MKCAAVMSVMAEAGVGFLPICGEGRRVVGVVTDRDLGVLSLADLIEHAPKRASIATVRAVLWREALGPRAGAPKGQPLLKDDPIAHNQPTPADDAEARPTVFTGGRGDVDTRDFPG